MRPRARDIKKMGHADEGCRGGRGRRGREIGDRDALLLHTPQSLAASLALDVRTGHEVLAIDPAGRTVVVRELATGRDYREAYDALVLSTGAAPVIPPVPGAGLPAVRVLRTVPDVD